MSPLSDLAHDAIESSKLPDRELLVGIYDAVREMNGSLKSHTLQLKYLWSIITFLCTGILSIIGLLVGHVL